MDFYPLSFMLEPGQRSVQTQLQGKKVLLQDIAVNLRGVNSSQTGDVKTLSLPTFALERNGSGWELSWDAEIDQELTVFVEAQGNGGQTTRAGVLLRVPGATATPEVARPGLNMSPLEKVKALRAAGIPVETAIEKVIEILGESVRPDIQAGLMKELGA